MASTLSNMLRLGTVAPPFRLHDTVSGRDISLEELPADAGTVVMFLCNHCPYVKHINHELVRVANEYIPQGVAFVAISSNDVVAYPDDSPDLMREVADELGYPFPYLFDETQEVARAYQAACTPDIYLFDRERRLVYRGQFDDSRPSSNIAVTGSDLRDAIDALLAGRRVSEKQIPSIGCGIKWKK